MSLQCAKTLKQQDKANDKLSDCIKFGRVFSTVNKYCQRLDIKQIEYHKILKRTDIFT